MNAYRSIGLIGLATGAMALGLMCMPDAWVSTWLVETVADQFRSDVVLNLFGAIAAIASGSYLFAAGNVD